MKKILINAKYHDEKRVAIVEGDRLVDFYVEVASREHLKGNIYKGRIVRVEPSLQAAFVDFGPKKHGFLQMREIAPEYVKEGAKRIQFAVSPGQELIVQVEKDERDTKGATLTTYLSLPGRYIVMMPGQDMVGISRKIEDKDDRERLKAMLQSLKLPKKTGVIVRTAGVDKTAEDISNDLKYLTKLWGRIQKDAKEVQAPALIYKEHDIAVRTVRDYLTSDVSEVLVDDPDAFRNVKAFLRRTLPWRKINVKPYKGARPVFDLHNIEDQISRLGERYVHLPSRGYVVFDKTEALCAIDVNSGRSRKDKSIEQTALRTNLEAADEISRQLRLRDIGGLIVIDFIDMESSKNRREVEERLKAALGADKAHTDIERISKFGILEMTRERLRTAYVESTYAKCRLCDGSGVVKTDEMTAMTAFRDMRMRASKGGIKAVACRLPVASANYLINAKRDEITQMEEEFNVKIDVLSDTSMIAGQYRLDAEKAEKKAEHAEKKTEHAGKKTETTGKKAEPMAPVDENTPE